MSQSVSFRETPKRRIFKSATFFYAEDCPRCGPTLLSVLPLFVEAGLQMIVRKPSREEMSTPGFAYPALFLPIGMLGLKQGILLVGEGMTDALQRILSEQR